MSSGKKNLIGILDGFKFYLLEKYNLPYKVQQDLIFHTTTHTITLTITLPSSSQLHRKQVVWSINDI